MAPLGISTGFLLLNNDHEVEALYYALRTDHFLNNNCNALNKNFILKSFTDVFNIGRKDPFLGKEINVSVNGI